jgi:hypothetical protein
LRCGCTVLCFVLRTSSCEVGCAHLISYSSRVPLFCRNITRRPLQGLTRSRLIIHGSSSIIQHSLSIVHRPSSIVHRPSSIVHRPSSIVHRPSSIVHRPSTIDHRPSSIVLRPSTITTSIISRHPSPNAHRRSPHLQRLQNKLAATCTTLPRPGSLSQLPHSSRSITGAQGYVSFNQRYGISPVAMMTRPDHW